MQTFFLIIFISSSFFVLYQWKHFFNFTWIFLFITKGKTANQKHYFIALSHSFLMVNCIKKFVRLQSTASYHFFLMLYDISLQWKTPGEELAKQLAKLGAKLILSARNEAELERVRKQLTGISFCQKLNLNNLNP